MSEFLSPAVQAQNIIRYVGDKIIESGEAIPQISGGLYSEIGAPSSDLAFKLMEELEEKGVLKSGHITKTFKSSTLVNVNLTLKGWEQYEAEKRGRFDGNCGFIAMKFGDDDLDDLVQNVVKPTLKEGIGYELYNMKDVSRAGIIDDIMRVQIRDSAFVIAELTHDNPGAYWEAGYAEGLGKPVIYICKKEKFDEISTHFDTNHCTTVLWSRDNDKGFQQELIATLRRSLDLRSEV